MSIQADQLSLRLQRLRTLYTLLATRQDDRKHDELLERTRAAIADVRQARAMLAARSSLNPAATANCPMD